MAESNNLSIEQQFKLVILRNKLLQLNKVESQKYLCLILQYMLVKDNIIKFIMKNNKL